MGRGRLRIWSAALALVSFAVDQAQKLWMLESFDIGTRQPVRVTGFFDLVLVWNRGISYGLFQQDEGPGRWLLVGFTLLAAIGLTIWMLRAQSAMTVFGLALIVGGALGNGLDRLLRGAVPDFFHFHIGGYSWYVFNLADVWIVAGVAVLLYDSIVSRPRNATKARQ